MTEEIATDAAPAVAATAPKATVAICSNCGTPLLGEHCYHCGQPVKGLVRRFSSVLGDIADTLFEIDTRLTRTIAPLLLRPGFLSTEYFAGRRVRYVSPVRLFFFVSVITFFVAQWTFDSSNTQAIQIQNDNGINGAMTVADVAVQRDIALKAIDKGRSDPDTSTHRRDNLKVAEDFIRKQADERIAELNAASAQGKPPPAHIDKLTFGDDKPWDPVTNPVHIASLPALANGWINQLIGRAQTNIARIKQNPNLLTDAVLSATPSTLFILMPLFAVLLKMTYVFKRRLYMEHFIVALHSHAFLCFALLLILVLQGLAGVAPPWMHTPLLLSQIALSVWMPLYLLLMQKRVYGQGWIMTTIKYATIGMLYFVLLTFGIVMTFFVKLIWL
jgi:hypothetical protein